MNDERFATNAATDATTDAATDAATDTATDAATDATTDAATDTATHAATHAATDAARSRPAASLQHPGQRPARLRRLRHVPGALAMLASIGVTVWLIPQRPQVGLAQPGSSMLQEAEDQKVAQALAQEAFEYAHAGQESVLRDREGLLRGWVGEHQDAQPGPAILFTPLYRTALGFVGHAKITKGSEGVIHLPRVFVSREPLELWTELPWHAFPHVAAGGLQATVAIDPSRGWLTADVTLKVDPGDNPQLALDFMAVTRNERPLSPHLPHYSHYRLALDQGVRLDEVSRDGRDCRTLADDLWLVVDVSCGAKPDPAGLVRWRLRYQGTPADPANTIDDGVAQLRHWLPMPLGKRTPVELSLIVPDSAAVIGMGPPRSVVRQGPWRTELRSWPANLPSPRVTVVPGAIARQQLTLAGVRVTLYGKEAVRLREALESAMSGLAALGAVLPPELALIVGTASFSGVGSVTVDADLERESHPAVVRWHLARFVAEQWLCWSLPTPLDGTPALCESLAQALAAATLTPAQRRVVRFELATGDTRSPSIPILDAATMPRGMDDPRSRRADRVLLALGERLGDERLAALLRALYLTPPPGGPTWRALLAAVSQHASAPDFNWLRSHLEAPQLPQVTLYVFGDRWNQKMVLHSSDPLALGASVEVALRAGKRELSRIHLTIQDPRVMEPVEVPRGADRLVVDPDLHALLNYASRQSSDEGLMTYQLDLTESPEGAEGAEGAEGPTQPDVTGGAP